MKIHRQKPQFIRIVNSTLIRSLLLAAGILAGIFPASASDIVSLYQDWAFFQAMRPVPKSLE